MSVSDNKHSNTRMLNIKKELNLTVFLTVKLEVSNTMIVHIVLCKVGAPNTAHDCEFGSPGFQVHFFNFLFL